MVEALIWSEYVSQNLTSQPEGWRCVQAEGDGEAHLGPWGPARG